MVATNQRARIGRSFAAGAPQRGRGPGTRPKPLRHGTRAAYTAGGCRCVECRAATAAYARSYYRRRRDGDTTDLRRRSDEIRHGTVSAYNHRGCRCGPCTVANREHCRRQRHTAAARRRDELERQHATSWPPRAWARLRRLPFASLEQLVQADSTVGLALRLRVHRRQLYRWRRYGVTIDQADTLAITAGYHPAEVWPQWWETAERGAASRAGRSRRA